MWHQRRVKNCCISSWSNPRETFCWGVFKHLNFNICSCGIQVKKGKIFINKRRPLQAETSFLVLRNSFYSLMFCLLPHTDCFFLLWLIFILAVDLTRVHLHFYDASSPVLWSLSLLLQFSCDFSSIIERHAFTVQCDMLFICSTNCVTVFTSLGQLFFSIRFIELCLLHSTHTQVCHHKHMSSIFISLLFQACLSTSQQTCAACSPGYRAG